MAIVIYIYIYCYIYIYIYISPGLYNKTHILSVYSVTGRKFNQG